ncbi:MAG TPA: shikimate kinase [Thermoanaerobaculia bacterium]|nr:shikimate kinase [Thermoanaerobaculia bacterium]
MIPLPRAPRVLYLIGLAGVGKSYVGDLIGRTFGYHVYHADDDLPAEMHEAVANNVLWTEEQVDGFHAMIRRRILELAQVHPRVVVTQATYFQRYRDLLREAIPDIEILWVVADHEVNVRRVRERKDYVSVEYFEETRHFFETPPEDTKTIVNDGDDSDVLRQLIAWYG